ncbi:MULTISPECIES: cysteine hydrolase family protein [unclassified Curtobacterium]|uniref:cysteine hydrolase family protein n=1 Tax=unclassified Curtobacterium TaxID=257496 RepID=UPI0008DC5CEA|nr:MULTISPECIES: cysteine hydrolase family protein [unclassified Curtobacterium]OIH94996.1 Isochorismatase [Curtobacterium sp. MCBA15_003]OII12899.1 Isochorismatase [Curtobacterium sp. MCBA15_009]OII32157.1 Isochorismatase [Curtobacterium sp. MMLR14_006]
MTRALVLVDIQRDYFPGGAFPLIEPEAAATAARTVLEKFRASGELVVHVFHVSTDPDASFFRPGTAGVEFHPSVEPAEGEVVLEKHRPNSFIDTGLRGVLDDADVTELVIVGMMSSMCIDSTTRAAHELGYRNIVVPDACTAPDLRYGDTVVPGAAVHAAFMAALDGSFATLTDSSSLS